MKQALKKVTWISALAITLFSSLALSIPLILFSVICLFDAGVLQRIKSKGKGGRVFDVA